MPKPASVSRRTFLERSATTAAVTLVSRHVLGGPRHVPPSDRINVAYVGCGTQGLRQLMPALKSPDLRIVAVCDPNRKSEDYVEWYPHELRDTVRTFLSDPTWAEGTRACPCGREVGQELVDRHYGSKPGAGCRAYTDFREMLAKEKDLDAVYIMTPDHLHATVALAAMKAGKHVIVHKPLGNVLHEARLVIETARETGAATHMFCAAGQQSTPQLSEWIQGGAIGPVREVHNWSTRPFWPQGMTTRPSETVPVPDGLDWDLWLGPVPHRPYSPAYTNAVFRGWYDFGTGALGDMGHYSFFQIFKILKLGSPLTVEASRSQYWKIDDLHWKKQVNTVSYPRGLAHPLGVPGAGGDAARRAALVRRRPAPAEAPRAGRGRRADAGGGPPLRGRRREDPGRLPGTGPAAHPEGEDAGLPASAADAAAPGRGAGAVGPRVPGHGTVGRELRERGRPSARRSCSARSPCASTRSCGGTPRALTSSTPPRPTR